MADQSQNRSFAIHPSKIIMFLIIVAVCMLFLAFSASYMYNRFTSDFAVYKVPPIFYATTVFILISSLFIQRAKKSFMQDEPQRLQRNLALTLLFTVLFLASQYVAWKMFFSQNDAFFGQNGKAYLYVLAGTHFAHVIAGIPFLAAFLLQARRQLKDPVQNLLYFSDETKRTRLNMIAIYWHFIDALWIYLILFFVINYFI